MNGNRRKPANRDACRGKTNGVDPRPTFTHCVACNYESKRDFDVCPKCKAKGVAVFVIRKA
ncbi:MAG: anaerobic ribonucleoside-triphosphate reductase [Nitrososphaerales archaeon]|nr:anaerobic ribonucleoside-triphosphate reductase [Nitrososphaerales archaeon]